ncbi:MAG: DUF2589 domain-containing protein [Chlorobaculum sp.]|nr:DUF2589 domain-containing protein [Chlorobaculum sp.]
MPTDNSAALTAQSALQAIPFSTLIGGPLDACIQAQAKAAQTSWEFIDKVGLWTDPATKEKKAVTVNFQYNKNGEMVNLVVPLLTIVPIPFLAITKVLIDFKANISASSSTVNSTSSSEDLSAGGSAQGEIGFGPFSVSFEAHANYSSKKDSKASQESKYSVEYTMNIQVEGGQADMPAGLAAILNILQSSVTDAPVGGGVTLSPQNGTIQAAVGSRLYLEATVKDGKGVLQGGATVTFNLSNIATGLKLKPIKATTGKLIGPEYPATAKLEANDKGVAGITLEVDSVDYKNYRSGWFDVSVTASDKDPKSGSKDVSSKCKIKMTDAQKPLINANKMDISLESNKTKDKLQITLTDSNGTALKDKVITYTVMDDKKCTVTPINNKTNENGVAEFEVTGIRDGQTSIEFTGETVTTNVNVNVSGLDHNSITVDKTSISLSPSTTEEKVTVTLLDFDNKGLPGMTISGKSENNSCSVALYNPSVDKTDSTGKLEFKVTRENDNNKTAKVTFSDATGVKVDVNVSIS